MTQATRTTGLARFLLRAEAGAVGGLIGAIAVALLFFLDGAIHLRPLAVPAALTSGLFGAATNNPVGTNGVVPDAINILEMAEYTVAHLLTFAAIGISAAFVLDGARFWKAVWSGAAYVGVTGTGLLYIVSWGIGTPVAVDVLGLPRVLLANGLAGAIIGVGLYAVEHGDDGNLPV